MSQQDSENVEKPSASEGTASPKDAANPRSTKTPAQRRLAKQTAHQAPSASDNAAKPASDSRKISDYASALADFAASPLFAKIMGSEKDAAEPADSSHHTVAKSPVEPSSVTDDNEATRSHTTGKVLPVTSSVIAGHNDEAKVPAATTEEPTALTTPEPSATKVTAADLAEAFGAPVIAADEPLDDLDDEPSAQEVLVADQAQTETEPSAGEDDLVIEEFARIGAEATPYPYRRYTQPEEPVAPSQPESDAETTVNTPEFGAADEPEVAQVHQAEALAGKFSVRPADDSPQTTVAPQPETASLDHATDTNSATEQPTASNTAEPLAASLAQDDHTHTTASPSAETSSPASPTGSATNTGSVTNEVSESKQPAAAPQAEYFDQAEALTVQFAAQPADFTTGTDANFMVETTALSGSVPAQPEIVTDIADDLDLEATLPVVEESVQKETTDSTGATGLGDSSAPEHSEQETATAELSEPAVEDSCPPETTNATEVSVSRESSSKTTNAAHLETDRGHEDVVTDHSAIIASAPATADNTDSTEEKLKLAETAESPTDVASADRELTGVKQTSADAADADLTASEPADLEEIPTASNAALTDQLSPYSDNETDQAAVANETKVSDQAEALTEQFAAQPASHSPKLGTSVEPEQVVAADEPPASSEKTAVGETTKSPIPDPTETTSVSPQPQSTDPDTVNFAGAESENSVKQQSANTKGKVITGATVTSAATAGAAFLQRVKERNGNQHSDNAGELPKHPDQSETDNSSVVGSELTQAKQAAEEHPDSDKSSIAEPATFAEPTETEVANQATEFDQDPSDHQTGENSASATEAESLTPDLADDYTADAAAAALPPQDEPTDLEAAASSVAEEETPAVEPASDNEAASQDNGQSQSLPQSEALTEQFAAQSGIFATQTAVDSSDASLEAPAETDTKPVSDTDAKASTDTAAAEILADEPTDGRNITGADLSAAVTPTVGDADSAQQAAGGSFTDATTGATYVAEQPRDHAAEQDLDKDDADSAADETVASDTSAIDSHATDPAETDAVQQADENDLAAGAAIAGAVIAGTAVGSALNKDRSPKDNQAHFDSDVAESTEAYHDEDFAAAPQPGELGASISSDDATNDARTLRTGTMISLSGETPPADVEPVTSDAKPEPAVTEYSSGPGKKPIRAAAILLAEDSTSTSEPSSAAVKPKPNKRLFIILVLLVLLFVAVACVAGYLFTRNSNSAAPQPGDGALAAPKSGIALEGSETAAQSAPPSAVKLQAEDVHVEPLGISGATLKLETSPSLQQAVAYIDGQPQTPAQLHVWTRDENQDYVYRGTIGPDQQIDLTPENTLLAIVAAEAPIEEGALPPLFPGGEILVETIIWP